MNPPLFIATPWEILGGQFLPPKCKDFAPALTSFRIHYIFYLGTAVAQCATNRKVAGSIPAGVNGFFIDIKSFRSHYDPGVDSASNRNEFTRNISWG